MSIDNKNREIMFSNPDEFVKLYNRNYQIDNIGVDKYVSSRKRKSK